MEELHWSELSAVIFGIFYVVLAARASVWCWVFGIISCSLWAYATYTLYDLYIDALLQVFYVVMGFFGIWQWMKGGKKGQNLPIGKMPWRQHLFIILGGLVISYFIAGVFSEFTPAAATGWDSLTTVFSVIATVLTVRKVLENWIYWIITDLIYVGLYFSRGSSLFTGLMVIYTVIAVIGWLEWRRQYALQT